jgi:hypothetical protein
MFAPAPTSTANAGDAIDDRLPSELILTASDRVEFEIFDPQGRMVRTFVLGGQRAGYHVLDRNGRDGASREPLSGVHLVRLLPSTGRAEMKLVLLH